MNHSFLSKVANTIFSDFGPNMMQAAVVMPNTRSIVYLKDEFVKLGQGKPLILPKMVSMDGFVNDLAGRHIVDDLEAIVLLYKSFQKVKQSDESLESFFPLGQTLYADFEEILRNLKPINLVFKELSRWEETGANFADFLDDEQKEFLERFWSHFNENQLTAMKTKFILLWRSLPGVFEDFLEALGQQNVLTSAMAYAKASEFLTSNDLISRHQKIYFIGFGNLSEAEIRIISKLHEIGKASLIWDLQSWYLQNPEHEAFRLFSRLKMKPALQFSLNQAFNQIGSELPETKFEIISCLGYAGMAQQIRHLAQNADSETALILTEPGLIQALIETGDAEVFPYNITMGFPLAFTQQARWIQKVFIWIERKEYDHAENFYKIIEDPFFEKVCPFGFSEWNLAKEGLGFYFKTSQLKSKFKLVPDWLWEAEMHNWLSKFLFWWKGLEDAFAVLNLESAVWQSFILVFEKLSNLVETIDIKQLTPKVIQQLYTPLLHKFPVAIKGSYKEGVQVMGLFESRLLDFDQVIVAPATEGSLTSKGGGQSFLTENLRRAFGLPIQSQKVEDEIYQFYRLTHVAKKITLLINQSSDAQPSRIVHQIRFTPGFLSNDFVQSFGHSMPLPKAIVKEKNVHFSEQLNRFKADQDLNGSATYLSPSSLHDLLQCELRFFYKKVEKLKEPEVLQNLEMNPRDFGKWVHETIQNIYELVGDKRTYLEKEDFETMKSNWQSVQYKVWNGLKEKTSEGDLDHFIIEREVGKIMAFRFFDHMSNQEKHRWLKNEMDLEHVALEFEDQKWMLGGRVDMVLESENQYWVIDLKTGAFEKPSSYEIKVDQLEKMLPKVLSNKDLFQMLVYDWLSNNGSYFKSKPCRSQLFYMADPNGVLIDPLGKTNGLEEVSSVFEELKRLIGSALQSFSDSNLKIEQTEERKYCAYCAFKSICKR